jgi:hypothetical protein
MPLNELTPDQVSTLLERECTDEEKAEVRAAVRQLNETVRSCVTRTTGQEITEGLLLASELQKARTRFAFQISRIVAVARRRHLDRTLHGAAEPERVAEARG